jgi:hypothetical protein
LKEFFRNGFSALSFRRILSRNPVLLGALYTKIRHGERQERGAERDGWFVPKGLAYRKQGLLEQEENK